MQCKYNVFINSGNQPNYFAKEFSSKEQIDTAINKITEEKNNIISNKTGDIYQDIKMVHDYLVDNLEYDTSLSKTNIYDIYGALVNKDIPPYVKGAREPIAYAGINSVGLRRRNFTNEQIRDIQEIYRYLYLSGYNNSDAIERIEAELPATNERDEIIMFVRNSKRGIIKGYL